jgi:hypothetical protein
MGLRSLESDYDRQAAEDGTQREPDFLGVPGTSNRHVFYFVPLANPFSRDSAFKNILVKEY